MKRIPAIKDVMTPFPYSIDSDKPLVDAKNMMVEHHIHHLPVTEAGKLFGVITLSDIRLSSDPDNNTLHKHDLVVKDFTVANPYTVELKEPLDNVLVHMASQHIGSVVVMRGDRLAGMFTLRDACRVFGEYLRKYCRPPLGGDDVA